MNKRTITKHTETITAAGREYPCEFRRQPGGGYLVTSPSFLPLAAYGDTLEIAREEARQGIEAWIEYADARELC